MAIDETSRIKSYIIRNFGIEAEQADKLVDELPALFSFTVDEYVRTRHLELQRQGLKNREIYSKIKQELGRLVFSAGNLSERQIRRIIYG